MQLMTTGRAVSASGGGYSRRGRQTQAAAALPRARASLAAGAMLAALVGCSSAPGSDPIAWWRQLEGGRLAQERPLSPNADAPYPNLASVPPRPAAPEVAARARIAAGLEGDRRDAAFATAQPIALPGARPPSPVPQEAPGGIGASLAAASAAPALAPATPPAAAPSAAAPSAATPAPAPAPVAASPARAASPPSAQAPASPAPAAYLPSMPDSPPPPPRLPGVAGVTRPAPVMRAPPPAPVAPVFAPGAPVALAFAPGSADLSEGAAAALRALAGTRGGRDIRVIGYGESASTDAASQASSLPLAFARARAIMVALGQGGVPPAALQISAEATGRGGFARIAE